MGSSSLITSFQVVITVSTRFECKEQDHKFDMGGFMSNLLVLIFASILMSCSSFQGRELGEISSPGYQYGRQMDERALRSGFMER